MVLVLAAIEIVGQIHLASNLVEVLLGVLLGTAPKTPRLTTSIGCWSK